MAVASQKAASSLSDDCRLLDHCTRADNTLCLQAHASPQMSLVSLNVVLLGQRYTYMHACLCVCLHAV